MRFKLATLISAGMLVLLAGSAQALTLGDPPPPISVHVWIKGDPVKEIQKDKIYVVEFWATWCGPCKTSIPHLTELAHQHKDIAFIGVSVFEHDDADVVPFVQEMGDKMDYHVAMDDKSTNPKGAMAAGWMDAASQDGIPTAFIIGKDSKILWIGHPMEMEKPLQEIIAGTYDLAAAKEAFVKKQQEAAMEQKLNAELDQAIGPAMEKKDYAAALKGIDDLIAKHPEGKRLLLQAKAGIAFNAKQWDSGYAALDQYADLSKDDASGLNELAWDIATSPAIEKRDLDRALKYAQQAVDASKGNDPDILDTLARIYFDKGDHAKAVEVEKKALGLAPPDAKADLAKTLEKYQQAK